MRQTDNFIGRPGRIGRFMMGDIVRLSDGTYDDVIGFDCGDGAVLGRTGQVSYRTVTVIGIPNDPFIYKTLEISLRVIGQE